jgi:hypothetical protein
MCGYLSKLAPLEKKIIVDKRDERIFEDLRRLKAKRIVAVVNGIHFSGVKQLWQAAHGQQAVEDVNPVGDMDINEIQESRLINEKMRDYYSKVTKSEPSSWQDYLTSYHKDNQEAERTRHVHFDSHE